MLTKVEQIQWLADIKSGKPGALDKVYTTYRKEFVKWMQYNFSCDENSALDIFQDSVIVLYRQIQTDKLTNLQSSLKTYLFAVGKRIWLNKNKNNKIKKNNIEDYEQQLQTDATVNIRLDLNDRQKLMLTLLNKLRNPCRNIIYLFYYKRYGLEAIAESMNYTSKEVAKTQKVRCMKLFRKVVKDKYPKGEL